MVEKIEVLVCANAKATVSPATTATWLTVVLLDAVTLKATGVTVTVIAVDTPFFTSVRVMALLAALAALLLVALTKIERKVQPSGTVVAAKL